MKFSRYTKFGHLRFKAGEPIARTIHQDAMRNYGVAANFTDDDNAKGKLFADSMLTARALLTLERAANQAHPLRTQEFLATHEYENGIAARETDTIRQRRIRLATIRQLRLDGRWGTIYSALVTLLGDDLAWYRPIRYAELTAKSKAPSSGAFFGNWETPIRIVRTSAQVVRKNVDITIPVEYVVGSRDQYGVGQSLLVEPGSNSRAEVVELVAVTNTTITAQFTHTHDSGVLITSQHHPRWSSDKRRHIIALKNNKATDPSARGSIDDIMRRLVRGPSVWEIVDQTGANVAGPFKIGQSPLGATTLGATAL